MSAGAAEVGGAGGVETLDCPPDPPPQAMSITGARRATSARRFIYPVHSPSGAKKLSERIFIAMLTEEVATDCDSALRNPHAALPKSEDKLQHTEIQLAQHRRLVDELAGDEVYDIA